MNRWHEFTLVTQLANAGSEVSRALNWRAKKDKEHQESCYRRAIELIELTISDPKNRERLKEVLRIKEALNDFFCGQNEYNTSEEFWRKYFLQFGVLARRNKWT
ncbi:MAG: hypothetical protein WC955_09175 [Elusimicrobiota bacterium]